MHTVPESNYMELKAQISELQAKLEAAKAAESDVQLAHVRHVIEEFGFAPDQVFTPQQLAQRRPMKYRWQGKSWSGTGAAPNWYKEATAMGVTKEQMLINPPPQPEPQPAPRHRGRPANASKPTQ